MRFLLFIITLIFSTKISLSDSIIDCNNFKGSQIYELNGKLINEDDAYSGQTIKIHISKNENIPPKVEWIGRNKFMVPIAWGKASQKEEWINFFHYNPDVYRVYTFFQKKSQLALVEIQTQLFTGASNVKSYIGSCNFYKK